MGLYSLQVGRPPIYILKHGLHLAIILLLLPNFVIFPGNGNAGKGERQVYDVLRLIITGVQIVLWLFSSIILRFEYRRALGHIWYMHPVFFWVSAVVYATDITYCLIKADATEETLSSKLDRIIVTVCTSLILACSVTLGILVLVYR